MDAIIDIFMFGIGFTLTVGLLGWIFQILRGAIRG